jgi:hypothetical protein
MDAEANYYAWKKDIKGATPMSPVEEDANPGEHALTAQGQGFRPVPLADTPSMVRAAADGHPIDAGAQVGIMRNLEFSAGGRAHRISTGPYTQSKLLVEE